MAQSVLVVDDEVGIVRLVSLYLHRAGFTVLRAGTGAQALDAIAEHRPDLIILDVGLPDIDGYSVCQHVRESADTPIIMLTARGEGRDRIAGLRLGADDYVSKPFQPDELVLRVQAVLRRRLPIREETHRYVLGDLCVEPGNRSVTLDGRMIELRPKEFDLLVHLISHPGRVYTRSQLLEQVWGYEYIGDDATLDVHVWRLRAKLGETGRKARYIHTVWGVGYCLKVEPDAG